MKRSLTIISYFFIAFTVKSQVWTYSKGGNAFDGEYRSSEIIGISDNRTYDRPLFAVNFSENSRTYNLYIGKVGFFCDNVRVRFAFDESKQVYIGDLKVSNKQEVVFLTSFHYFDKSNDRIEFNIFQFLELVMKSNTMHVRLEDDCDIKNMDFSLSGSSKAITYVYGDQAEKIEKTLNIFAERREKDRKELELKSKYTSGPAVLDLKGERIILWDRPFPPEAKSVALLTNDDTVEILNMQEKYFQIMTKDSLTGWCHYKFVAPLVQ